jgi:Na+/proline symporter
VWENIPVLKEFLYVLVPGVVVSTIAVVVVSLLTTPPPEPSAADIDAGQ